ncbi:MAG TPA: hypothetical protein VIK51_26000 [Vicinamibacteria bacterium]|jgi:prolyl oligopeptidase
MRGLLVLGSVCVVPCALASGQSSPPAATVREVTDTYFGKTVTDPYRWMEDDKDAELTSRV